MCRPEHAYAAQMHARLKPATPASRLARVNCSIVVSPINISYSLYKYVGRCHIYNIVYTMLCGVRSLRARYGYRAHIIYNVIIRSCHTDDHGKGLSTRILEFHRGTRHTISTYRPSKTGTRDPQWKQLTHWRFPRP